MRAQCRFGRVVNSDINALKFFETIDVIDQWIINRQSKYVCVCNTHSIVTAGNDKNFNKALESAGLCVPDGMPLVWALKMYGFSDQDRVDGPNLMLKLCEKSAIKGYRIFLYGGTDKTLDQLEIDLRKKFKGINIVGKYSPPFRKMEYHEDEKIVQHINSLKPNLIFVSLGCPKQEKWMFEHKDEVQGVMLGVGAAFDFIIGNIKRPPMVFQKSGLEWLFRLITEPRRLWKRYFYNNPVYIYRFIKTFRENKSYTQINNK